MPLRPTATQVSAQVLPKAQDRAVARRDLRLDALRGLFLVIMTTVHVPTPLSRLFQEPFGFISAAEGFVFLGACLAGFIYGKTYLKGGRSAMSQRVWTRVKQLYSVHLGLLLPISLVAWLLAARCAPLAGHFHDFLLHPKTSLALMPLLLHQPPLFDILPLYIVMLLATPDLLTLARRFGWGIILTGSGLVWLAAQFKLDAWLITDPAPLLPLRFGSFSLLAWQFLWVSGLALGDMALRGRLLRQKSRLAAGVIAGTVVLAGLLARHGLWPHSWFPDDLYLWMDKWTLGPLRLLNFAAWVVLLLAWRPPLPALLSPLALLGRNSLAVFSFHVPLAIAATALIEVSALSPIEQTVAGLLVLAALFPWAAWLEIRKSRGIPVTSSSNGYPGFGLWLKGRELMHRIRMSRPFPGVRRKWLQTALPYLSIALLAGGSQTVNGNEESMGQSESDKSVRTAPSANPSPALQLNTLARQGREALALRFSRLFGERVHHLDMNLFGRVHHLDDLAERGGFIGADGQLQVGSLRNGVCQLLL
jgi:hypothetical protein